MASPRMKSLGEALSLGLKVDCLGFKTENIHREVRANARTAFHCFHLHVTSTCLYEQSFRSNHLKKSVVFTAVENCLHMSWSRSLSYEYIFTDVGLDP